jgi:5-methylcytosine-specific restriction endonuclease McrA
VKQRYDKDPEAAKRCAYERRVNETVDEREARLEYFRRWNKENPERAAMGRERRRVRQAGVESDGHTIAGLHAYWKTAGYDLQYCSYCDGFIRNWKSSIGDHVVPLSKDGSDVLENLVPCCWTCNSGKGNRLLHTEWTPPNKREAC